MQQIAPDVEFRFEFQALNALQHGTEDYCAHMFVNGSIAAARRNVATVGGADTNLRLHLADTNGRVGKLEVEACPKSDMLLH